MILLTDAAINLKMFRDPRSVRLKSNLIQRRHTSAETCPVVDVSVLDSQHLFKAAGVSAWLHTDQLYPRCLNSYPETLHVSFRTRISVYCNISLRVCAKANTLTLAHMMGEQVDSFASFSTRDIVLNEQP